MEYFTALPLAGAALLALSPAVSGQVCNYTIDSRVSKFTWSGTTSLGAITATPADFALAGNLEANVAIGFTTGQLTGGGAAIVPDLAGHVHGSPGVHLLDLSASNLSFSVASTVFEGLGGAFTTELVLTIQSGLLSLVPLVGAPTVVDLTGATSDSVTVSGQGIIGPGFDLILAISDISASFDLQDPVSGLTGTITLRGQIGARSNIFCDITRMFAEPEELSIAAGGTQNMILDIGWPAAGSTYLLLGSASGTAPGIPGLLAIPLNPDGYFDFTLKNPNTLIAGSLGFLDANGKAYPSLAIAPGALTPSLVGLTLNHAAVLINVAGVPALATNPVPLKFQP